MPAAGDIGLCENVCMGLYGEISKKPVVTLVFRNVSLVQCSKYLPLDVMERI
jgi:hypothetical protein